MYHLSGNVISATVGFVYISLQLQYVLPSSTRFGQFQMFGKIQVGALSSPATPKKSILYIASEFLFMATSALDLTFLAPLT